MITVDQLSSLFIEVADTLVVDFDPTDFLHTLTRHVAELSGADSVGIVLANASQQLRFVAASSESGRDMEMFQLQDAEGPCRDCYTRGVAVSHTDLGDGTAPWPVFAPRAVRAGIRSVHAFPMRLREQTIGALNLFGREPLAFDAADSRIVQALADVATIALLQERNTSRAEAVAEQLQGALTSRVVIEQAKGVLAQSDGISLDEAFALMRDESRRERRKMADVAAEVVQRSAVQEGGPGRATSSPPSSERSATLPARTRRV